MDGSEDSLIRNRVMLIYLAKVDQPRAGHPGPSITRQNLGYKGPDKEGLKRARPAQGMSETLRHNRLLS